MSNGKAWQVLVVAGFLALVGAALTARADRAATAASDERPSHEIAASSANSASSNAANDAAAQAAFTRAWKVFTSPRCQNCHPSGDAPLQGDDSHTHIQNVKRGPNGHGLYGMKCSACHQDANLSGIHMPPGNPKWFLPPPGMKMVFVGRTPGELCRQLKDPAQNGNRTLAQILEHVTSDPLVGWGWNPGDGRTLPPLSRPDFVAAVREWIHDGAGCPK